ncbi:MAG TPA: MarC family protein [Novosphingobium sp.]
MIELFVSAFVTLLVVIDPLGCAPIYAGLSRGAGPRQAFTMALRASVIATLILFGFALFGENLLAALHIGLDAFRIAGGLMLFLIALDMVFERRTKRREERAETIHKAPEVEDVSVFPIAMPMIAGPGSIATVMLLMARAQGQAQSLVILAALAAIMLLTFIALAAATPLMRLFGERIEAIVTRLLGVLLAALATQYVIDGVRAAFA